MAMLGAKNGHQKCMWYDEIELQYVLNFLVPILGSVFSTQLGGHV